MYVHNTTKMAVHPSHEYNQTSMKKQNDNKTVLLETHNIFLGCEVRKIIFNNTLLSGGLAICLPDLLSICARSLQTIEPLFLILLCLE